MAGNRSLGTLTIDLVAKIGGFTAGMTAAERAAAKSLGAIEKRAYAFGKALGTGIKIAGAAAATALVALTKSAIDNADALRDSSIQLGISTETLSAYGYAAQQTGTDLDGLSKGLKILSKNLADAENPASTSGKVFESLGISVTDAEGNLRKLDDVLPDIANAFKSLEDGTQKAALAQQLFGKSGLELTEFLNSGAEGLAEFTRKAEELGIIVGTDTANAADEFNDKMADLKALLSGFGNQLAAELLPRLIDLADYLKESATEGAWMSRAVKDIGTGFDFFISQLKVADEVGESFRRMLAATSNTVSNLRGGLSDLLSLNIGGFISKMNEARQAATSALLAGFNIGAPQPVARTSAGSSRRGGAAMNMTPGVSTINQEALSRALSGVTDKPAKKASGGKSEAEKEADQLKRAYESLKESQLEQIALFGQVGEAAKVRYDIEHGELAKLAPALQQESLQRAQQIDSMKEMKELEDAAAQASEKESERIRDGIKDTDMLLKDMQFELDIMNLSNEAREKAIFLRGLDADATDEQRAAAGALFDELERANEMKDIMDDFKEGLADAFVDFVSGAKSAKEAFGDFADALFKRALQFVADKAIQAMFDAFNGNSTGTSTSGGTGGGWQQWLGTIIGAFGGGKAAGGGVKPWSMYEVNELGMEGLTVGGRDYLMTGSKSGTVTPANRMGGAVYNLNNTFMVPPGQQQRTQEQQAQKMGQKVEEITRRNS